MTKPEVVAVCVWLEGIRAQLESQLRAAGRLDRPDIERLLAALDAAERGLEENRALLGRLLVREATA